MNTEEKEVIKVAEQDALVSAPMSKKELATRLQKLTQSVSSER